MIDVKYAYDGRNESSAVLGRDILAEGEWTLRDFTGSGLNTSKALPEKDISIITSVSKKDASAYISDPIEMHVDISPSAESNGIKYTQNSGIKTRLWINDPLEAFAPVPNVSASWKSIVPELWNASKDNGIRHFIMPNNPETSGAFMWPVGSNVQFTFKINDPSLAEPLYAARLKVPGDLTSLDLWSFEITGVTLQRGGVTIMNNVINVNVREQTIIQVDMPRDGNLNVIVMTMDGNIVKYLHHGSASKGTHHYYWNGTNGSGNPVARGLYFVRVVGPDIEETRKVMCVKP